MYFLLDIIFCYCCCCCHPTIIIIIIMLSSLFWTYFLSLCVFFSSIRLFSFTFYNIFKFISLSLATIYKIYERMYIVCIIHNHGFNALKMNQNNICCCCFSFREWLHYYCHWMSLYIIRFISKRVKFDWNSFVNATNEIQ